MAPFLAHPVVDGHRRRHAANEIPSVAVPRPICTSSRTVKLVTGFDVATTVRHCAVTQ